MLKTPLKTALLLILGLGAVANPATAAPKHGHHSKGVTIAIVTHHGRHGLERELARALEHNLPRDIDIVRNASRADYILEVRERRLDTDLRIKDRDEKWLIEPYHGRKRHGGNRIGWTEVSAIALANYDFTIILKDRHGRVLDHDRFKGRVREYVQWGEDLRIATRHGLRPYNRYPNAHVEALFACAPGTGEGPYAALRSNLAGQLAHKIAAKTIDARALYARNSHHYPKERYGIGFNYRGNKGLNFNRIP